MSGEKITTGFYENVHCSGVDYLLFENLMDWTAEPIEALEKLLKEIE